MCRWFAYISPNEPACLSDVLIKPAHSITQQVSDHYLPYLLPHGSDRSLSTASDETLVLRNHLLNYDGLGIAWYTSTASAYTQHQTGPRPALYKSQSPPTNDFNFRHLCENTESTCIFAHIRATGGGAAVSVLNSHPFVFGRHTFMHNGEIKDFKHVKRQLMGIMAFDAYDNITGTTDTEHAAALYMTYLCGPGASSSAWQKKYTLDEMRRALQHTVISILEVQQRVLGEGAHANGLNLCATDGEQLVACRFRNHESEFPASLYWSKTAGRTLNRKYPGHPDGGDVENADRVTENETEHGRHIIVASEPTTYDQDQWHLITKNHILMVDEQGVESEVLLEYDSKLNALT